MVLMVYAKRQSFNLHAELSSGGRSLVFGSSLSPLPYLVKALSRLPFFPGMPELSLLANATRTHSMARHRKSPRSRRNLMVNDPLTPSQGHQFDRRLKFFQCILVY